MFGLSNLMLLQCSRDDVGNKLRKNITKIPAVHISNPKTQEFQVKKSMNAILEFWHSHCFYTSCSACSEMNFTYLLMSVCVKFYDKS